MCEESWYIRSLSFSAVLQPHPVQSVMTPVHLEGIMGLFAGPFTARELLSPGKPSSSCETDLTNMFPHTPDMAVVQYRSFCMMSVRRLLSESKERGLVYKKESLPGASSKRAKQSHQNRVARSFSLDSTPVHLLLVPNLFLSHGLVCFSFLAQRTQQTCCF